MAQQSTATEHKLAHPAIACTATDLFTIGDAPEGFIDQLNEYLSVFAQPVKNADGKRVCMSCGEVMDGMLNVFGIGVAAEWDLAHGEARCSGCHWPMRGMHYPKDKDGGELLSLRNFFLAYMPEHVEGDA